MRDARESIEDILKDPSSWKNRQSVLSSKKVMFIKLLAFKVSLSLLYSVQVKQNAV